MKIYTKTGDDGETGLFAGPRVHKDDPRIEALGTVDELNAILGVVRAEQLSSEFDDLMGQIQNCLFVVGAQLATPDPSKYGEMVIDNSQILDLEQAIDRNEARLRPLRQFILPGGTRTAAAFHLARAVCRRAERRVISLRQSTDQIPSRNIVYLNRLSDLFFVLARVTNDQAGREDVPWDKSKKG